MYKVLLILLGLFLGDLAFSKENVYHIDGVAFTDDLETSYCTHSWEVDKIWHDEGLDLAKYKSIATKNYELLNDSALSKDAETKIPHISHHIWFTDPSAPQELKKRDRDFLIKKIENLNSLNGHWRSILWVNTKEGIPETLELAKTLGMEVKTLDLLTSPFYEIIKVLIQRHYFGLATDIWRVQVVKDMGGFYSDNDYRLDFNIDDYTRTFHSFFGFDDYSERYVGNAILAATKNHPIMVAYYKLIYRNLFETEKAPDYVKNPCNQFSRTIMSTGPTVLTLAIAKEANREGFQDVVLPHGIVFKLVDSMPESLQEFYRKMFNPRCNLDTIFHNPQSQCLKPNLVLDAIGNDQYSGSWIKEGYYEPTPPLAQNLLGAELGVVPNPALNQRYMPYQLAKATDLFKSLSQRSADAAQNYIVTGTCQSALAKIQDPNKHAIAITSLEYGPYKVGGVAAIVNTLTPMLQKRFQEMQDFQAYFVLPYYSEGMGLAKKAQPFCQLTHIFNYKEVHTQILKTELSFQFQGEEISIPTFLVRPDEQYPQLFTLDSLASVYRVTEFSNLYNRILYYNSALAAFFQGTMPGGQTFFDIVHAHSFGAGLSSLIAGRSKHPKIVAQMHNLNWDQGQMDQIRCGQDPCNLMRETMRGADKVLTVSNTMISEGLSSDIKKSFHLQDLYSQLYSEHRLAAIPNGIIFSAFDPSKSLGNYSFDWKNTNIIDAKFAIKDRYLRKKGFLSDPNKPLFIYVGRFSLEKGTDMLETAAAVIKALGGSFIVMGTGMNFSDHYVEILRERFRNDPDIYVMKGNYQEEQANAEGTGLLVRAASDFTIVPSHEEAFGLVPIEAFAEGSIAITSSIGGMKDYIRNLDLRNLNEGNSFNYDEAAFEPRVPFSRESIQEAMVKEIQRAFTYFKKVPKEQRSSLSRRLILEAEKFDWLAPEGSVNKLIKLYEDLLKKTP